ncbi:VOC family protein [bacterium]|nr:VOC family protein [bacterium]NUN45269.1 VOC family protein [bacterium]HMW33880.1 VOC family protein [bacterium]HMW35416.1 VOC family protein [bacterium]HMY36868.1 VOC family protein [bacterium]
MPGFLTTIKYVCIYASDFDRSLAFYRDGLGLQVTYKEDGFAQFNTEGTILTLEKDGFRSDEPKDYRKVGFLIQFEVEDIEKAVTALKAKNVKFTQTITDKEFGRTAIIVDPDGNQIMLLEQ